MPDSIWQDLIAPFRRVNETLKTSASHLRSMGDDKAFQRMLDPLDSLPASATTNAFGATEAWHVDLSSEEAALPLEDLKIGASFEDRLKKPVSPREPLAVVSEKKRAVSDDANENSTSQPHSPVAKSEMAHGGNVSKDRTPAKFSPGTKPGAWMALEQIAKLTEALLQNRHSLSNTRERSVESRQSMPTPPPAEKSMAIPPPSPGPQGPSQSMSHTNPKPKNGFGLLAQLTEALLQKRHSPSNNGETSVESRQSMPTPPPAQESMATYPPSPGPPGPSQPMSHTNPTPENGFERLAQYVNTLWNDTGESQAGKTQHAHTRTSPTPSNPAPRAPSLLQETLATETMDLSATHSRTKKKTLSDQTGEKPINGTWIADADIEERINRDLIEQAWLRGGDLT